MCFSCAQSVPARFVMRSLLPAALEADPRRDIGARFALRAVQKQCRGAVINTYVVDGKNIWMAEGGGSSSFLLKAPNILIIGRRCRTNDFDGNVAFETIVADAKHLAHPITAYFFE